MAATQTMFLECFAQFLEVLYDPYFTWRNFLRGETADYAKLAYKISPMHAEIVPFIYDCFQTKQIARHPEIGKQLIHVLGAVISGSQVRLALCVC